LRIHVLDWGPLNIFEELDMQGTSAMGPEPMLERKWEVPIQMKYDQDGHDKT
jgi:hypothetical protein